MFLLLLGSVVHFQGNWYFFSSGEDQLLLFRPTAVLIINHQIMFIMCVWFYLVGLGRVLR